MEARKSIAMHPESALALTYGEERMNRRSFIRQNMRDISWY